MKQNILTYSELEKILKIEKTVNIDEDIKFDFVKTLKYIDPPEESSVLYFPVYLNVDDDLGGWYPINSDTRKKVNEYSIQHPEYTYVLDEETYNNLTNDKIKVIVIKDIMESVDRFSIFTKHFYNKAALVIRYLTVGGEEDEDYSKFPQYFNRFDKVYLFSVWNV